MGALLQQDQGLANLLITDLGIYKKDSETSFLIADILAQVIIFSKESDLANAEELMKLLFWSSVDSDVNSQLKPLLRQSIKGLLEKNQAKWSAILQSHIEGFFQSFFIQNQRAGDFISLLMEIE